MHNLSTNHIRLIAALAWEDLIEKTVPYRIPGVYTLTDAQQILDHMQDLARERSLGMYLALKREDDRSEMRSIIIEDLIPRVDDPWIDDMTAIFPDKPGTFESMSLILHDTEGKEHNFKVSRDDLLDLIGMIHQISLWIDDPSDQDMIMKAGRDEQAR